MYLLLNVIFQLKSNNTRFPLTRNFLTLEGCVGILEIRCKYSIQTRL